MVCCTERVFFRFSFWFRSSPTEGADEAGLSSRGFVDSVGCEAHHCCCCWSYPGSGERTENRRGSEACVVPSDTPACAGGYAKSARGGKAGCVPGGGGGGAGGLWAVKEGMSLAKCARLPLLSVSSFRILYRI